MPLPLFRLASPPPRPEPFSPYTVITLPFYVYLFQPNILEELYNWVILTGWTAIWLLLAALAFFLLQTPYDRKVWRQNLALLLVGAVGIWTFVVAYNGYQRLLYLYSRLPQHGVGFAVKLYRIPYQAAIHTCQWQFALAASVLVLLIVGTAWRLRQAFSRKLDLAPGKYTGRFVMSLAFAAIGLGGLAVGVFLITLLYLPLIYNPQALPYQVNEPTTLELIGLFTVCLGGPLILLLLSLASFVERHKLLSRSAFRERRLSAMQARSPRRT